MQSVRQNPEAAREVRVIVALSPLRFQSTTQGYWPPTVPGKPLSPSVLSLFQSGGIATTTHGSHQAGKPSASVSTTVKTGDVFKVYDVYWKPSFTERGGTCQHCDFTQDCLSAHFRYVSATGGKASRSVCNQQGWSLKGGGKPQSGGFRQRVSFSCPRWLPLYAVHALNLACTCVRGLSGRHGRE